MVPFGEELPNLVKTPWRATAWSCLLACRALVIVLAGVALGNLMLLGIGLVLVALVAGVFLLPSRLTPHPIVLTDQYVIGAFGRSWLGHGAVRYRAVPYHAIQQVKDGQTGPKGGYAPARIAIDKSVELTSTVFVYGWGRLPTARRFYLSDPNARRLREALEIWTARTGALPSGYAAPRDRTWRLPISVPFRAV